MMVAKKELLKAATWEVDSVDYSAVQLGCKMAAWLVAWMVVLLVEQLVDMLVENSVV